MGFRSIFLVVVVLGAAVALAWHAPGALTARDALGAAAVAGAGVTGSPPAPVSTRLLELGVALVRAVWAPAGLFRAVHLSAGLWLALAAGLTALVAARAAAGRSLRAGKGLAAGAFAGAAVLLGLDTGGLGLQASPVAPLLALLAGSAAAFTARRPHPLLGGLLLGLATAEHPFVVFLLPGFGALAIGGTVRTEARRSGGFLRTTWIGFGAGLLAMLLPLVEARNAHLLLVNDPHSPARAIAAWWGDLAGPFWTPVGPRGWIDGMLEVVFAAWRAAGPLGFVLGLAALATFFGGGARLVRPFLLVFGVPALALVVGEAKDPRLAAALTGWAFLFWTVPTLAAAWSRVAGETEYGALPPEADRRRADARAPVAALLAAGLLLGLHAGRLDRSAEREPEWATSVVETLPPDAVLLTDNPVHVAAAAESGRSDVDVVYLPEPSSLWAAPSGRELLPPDVRPPTDRIRPGELQRLLAFHLGERPVLIDASVFFDAARRAEVLAGTWDLVPHGLAFRVVPLGGHATDEMATLSLHAWDGLDTTPGTPPSPLRDGLDGDDWFARSLVQSASLWVDHDRDLDAEREFLVAASHPRVNPNLAALGLGRVFFERRRWEQAATTIDLLVRDDREGAWSARRLLANSYLQAGDREAAARELAKALRLAPREAARERESMERLLRSLRKDAG
jgi:hypothetical protein